MKLKFFAKLSRNYENENFAAALCRSGVRGWPTLRNNADCALFVLLLYCFPFCHLYFCGHDYILGHDKSSSPLIVKRCHFLIAFFAFELIMLYFQDSKTTVKRTFLVIDLTLNFIGDIGSVDSLRENSRLETLFLTGTSTFTFFFSLIFTVYCITGSRFSPIEKLL